MVINKKDVLRLLEKIAIFLELKGENPFKIAAYRRAAQALEKDSRSLNEIEDFTKIKGIGKGTNAVIVEYIENQHSSTLEELENTIPKGLIPLLKVPGLGGKTLAKLYQELKIVDAESLKEAIDSGKVEKLPRFGKKSVENMRLALEEMGKQPDRLPISFMYTVAENVENYLQGIPEIIRFSIAGSSRRMRETLKDLDFIIATDEPQLVREALLKMERIKEVIAQGDTKVSVVLEETYDVQMDFRLVTNEAFTTTLHHFTGSKDHNVAMRQLAKARGEKISEYGVEVEETGEVITFQTEEDFFQHFDLHYIPPEVRENKGEIEAFKEAIKLIELEDIRGDLHMHTTWSDGAQTVEEMVLQARKKGYEFIAITDHSKALRVANGLDETRLRKQREEIHELNEKYDDIKIFAGVEMDILPNGELDFSDDFLREMDFVIAAIHSSFNQTEEQIMKRIYTALENPYVSLIAHPTGRLIGRRDGYDVNVEKLIERAKETNTALEINANPHRLDLAGKWANLAQENGVKLAINTDAHSFNMLEHMAYGVRHAKRAWIQKDTVLNTWSKDRLTSFFNRNK
ncbi:DNA polymerase/3'-5' exonuclease PolX [Virgibacillus soli]|uniref:DNA polymerase/3'-5' exonuclease PolX n=1 Tax=Paracerasibacillus soli TaxID=480284 RepID=UPI0035EA2653